MSTRRKLNVSLAAVGLLLLAAVAYVGLSQRQGGAEAVQLEVATHQQERVAVLVAWADSLAIGTSRDQVLAARTGLGHAIVGFDQGLGALLGGGRVEMADGQARLVARVTGAAARHALEQASHVWLETGMPLGDLAAGQYSAYSAAGQQALAGLHEHHAELTQHLQAAAEGIRQAAAQRAQLAGYATWAAAALAAGWLVLLVARLWPTGRRVRARSAAAAGPESRPLAPHAHHAPDYADEAPRRGDRPGRRAPYAPAIDFDNVNAAVDQLSVDMNNIAGNTEKMRQAIESVGFALQGMLYSLNEMAQDTAEGHKIVRNANNAASFTAEAATELVDSAREMARIVGRVTQLAVRTRQVAAQIEGEAVNTGRTGEAFTSVVAQEVKGLAQQTNRATQEIDQTVNDVLATARQYEEAIGQIIKNVAAINKVSENLGQLMLDPPRRVQAASAPEPALAATPAPAAAPQAVVAAPAPAPEPAVAVAPAPAAAPPPAPAPAVRIEDDPVAPEPTPREVAETTSAAITAAATQPAPAPAAAPPAPAAAGELPKPDGGSNGNVFMLGKPRRKPTVAEVLGTEPAAQAPAAPAPTPATAAPAAPAAPAPVAAAPAPAPEPLVQPATPPTGHGSPQADGGSNGNVFLLNQPQAARPAAPAPAPAPTPAPAEAAAPAPAPTPAPTPAAAPAAEAKAPETAEAATPSGSNIFMLNRPKRLTSAGDGAATAVAEPPAAPAAADPPAAAPAAAPAAEGEAPKKNFIMLNSPKKPK